MVEAKILVVDDDPAIRNLVYRFLAKQDYDMESAADGQKALALFEQFTPDLVILDVNLPDTNGYDLCKEMQSRTGRRIKFAALPRGPTTTSPNPLVCWNWRCA